VLGQLRALLGVDDEKAEAFQRVKEAIHRSIRGRSWASFHDRVSGYIIPTANDPITSDTQLSNDEIVEELYDGKERRIDPRHCELVDHLTLGLLPSNRPHSYFTWEIEPGRFHIIEAVAEAVRRVP
jgi:hypothetical protein